MERRVRIQGDVVQFHGKQIDASRPRRIVLNSRRAPRGTSYLPITAGPAATVTAAASGIVSNDELHSQKGQRARRRSPTELQRFRRVQHKVG